MSLDSRVGRTLERVLEGRRRHDLVRRRREDTPGRILNVYVRPSAETAGRLTAASGTSCEPSGSDASGWASSLAHVIPWSCQLWLKNASAGST